MSSGEAGLSVAAKRADPAAFEPFGALVERPRSVGDRMELGAWLDPVVGRTLRCHLNRVAPVGPSVTVEEVECHPHSAQLFVPMGVSRYLVVVMPPGDSGAPDSARAQAFVVPGTTCVVYRPGTWHSGIAVLDVEGSFFVGMWRGGDDDVFASIPPMEVKVSDFTPGGGDRG